LLFDRSGRLLWSHQGPLSSDVGLDPILEEVLGVEGAAGSATP